MLPPGALLSFKSHINAYFGISSIFPLSPTALVIRRSKDRLMQSYEAVKDGLISRGYNAQVVGPLSKYLLKEQLLLLSNASLYVFVAGAEIGPILLSMPTGSTMCEIFPFPTAEPFPFWYGAELGLKISLHEDLPADPFDSRCTLLHDQLDINSLYHADVLNVNVTSLLESINKVLRNFSQYVSPKCSRK
jgi:hypothetical protein